MELKTFAEEDFDPKKWIDRAWSASGNEEKETFVVNTVSRLQLYMKQLTNSLDETTTQIVTSIPRVLQDVEALHLEGSMLQNKLQALERKVQSVEEETGHSIESLQRIDDLKSRLENAASSLREADKWAQIAVSLEEILETGVPTHGEKLAELTSQVTAMTASLEVLSDAPDYDTKQVQLEALYNRLEAALTPSVINALTQRNAEHTSSYVSIFTAMGRHQSLIRYWRRVEAEKLEGSNAHENNARQLRADILTHAHSQVEWLTEVLGSETPLNELTRLYTDLLLSLEPSPTKMLSANLKLCSSPEEAINLFMDVRQDIDVFVASLRNLLEMERPNKEYILPAALKQLGRAIYAPLRDALTKYTDFQALILTTHLKSPDLEQNDPLERARSILCIVERSENWLKSAHNNSRKIAGNAIYPFFIPAVEAFTSAICSLISSTMRQIETDFLSSSSRGTAQGVLSRSFPAALTLGSAVAALLDILLTLRGDLEREIAVEEPEEQSPLLSVEQLSLEESGRASLLALRTGRECAWTCSTDDMRRISASLRTLALTILVEPIATQLEKIPHLSVWNNNDSLSTDLPDFSLSPQEYITVAGQYLMTLPQHLELHLSEKQAPWQFLTEVCNHTCDMYAEKIMSVKNMDTLGIKRCLTDIVYLSSVVEDLGSGVTTALKNLDKSLRQANLRTE